MKGWKIAAVAALTFALAACGRTATPQDPAAQNAEPVTRTVRLLSTTGEVVPYEYTRSFASDGSPYEIYVPLDKLKWNDNNRRLAVYTHGYTDPLRYPVKPAPGWSDSLGVQPFPQFVNGILTTLQGTLVANGFAFAWSSYNKPGYAINSGVNSTNEVIAKAKEFALLTHAEPVNRTYVLGHSLGGIIGVALAEGMPLTEGNTPQKIDGVLAMCGPVNGMTQQVKYAGDLRALYDYYFQGNYKDLLKIQVPTTDPKLPAISPDDEQLSKLEWGIYSLGDIGAPVGSVQIGQHLYYGLAETVAQAVKAAPAKAVTLANTDQLKLPYAASADNDQLIHSITDALFYPIRGVSDATSTAGGSPFDNRKTSYTRGGTADRTLNGSTGVIRYTPSTAAQTYVKANYDSTGRLKTKVLTLHTNQDPQVPFRHEADYGAKVKAAGYSSKLAQQYTRHYGHCAMTETETANALQSLVMWAEAGPLLEWLMKPRTGDVTAP